jgi:hypothetical protein
MARTTSLPASRLKRVGLALALIGLLGIAFEEIGRHRDRRRHEQIGKSVNMGGRTLNISCLGQGSPTVVFDTYGHQSGYSWIAVQSEVAKYSRACWYDRAGYGWSELGSSPRTFQSVASDLHALLREAGIPSPIVLVGAGDAASHIRVYHGSYPAEVGGIVMLDANDVDDPNLQIPDSEKGGFQRYFGTWASGARRAACWVRPFLGRVGIIRLANLFGKPRSTNSFGLNAKQQAELDDLSDNATTQQVSEACAREESMKQVRAAGGLRSVPLVVIVSNTGRPRSNSQDATEVAWQKNRIDRVPNALAGLSTNGRVVLIEGGIKPEAIVRTILDVLPMDQGSK